MDVYGRCKIRRFSIVEPVIVVKPGIFIGDGDQLARSMAIQVKLSFRFLTQNPVNGIPFLKPSLDCRTRLLIPHIDMLDLMIGYRRSLAAAGAQYFTTHLF